MSAGKQTVYQMVLGTQTIQIRERMYEVLKADFRDVPRLVTLRERDDYIMCKKILIGVQNPTVYTEGYNPSSDGKTWYRRVRTEAPRERTEWIED